MRAARRAARPAPLRAASPRSLLVAGLVLGVAGSACRREAPAAAAEEAAVVAAPAPRDAPWDPRGIHYWVAGCNVGEDLWKFREHSTTVWCDPRGRELSGSEGRFDWPVYLGPGEIAVLELEGHGLDSVEWTFWWARGETFEPARTTGAAETGSDRVRFDLGGEAAWHAAEEDLLRLRLTWIGRPVPGARLLSVRAR